MCLILTRLRAECVWEIALELTIKIMERGKKHVSLAAGRSLFIQQLRQAGEFLQSKPRENLHSRDLEKPNLADRSCSSFGASSSQGRINFPTQKVFFLRFYYQPFRFTALFSDGQVYLDPHGMEAAQISSLMGQREVRAGGRDEEWFPYNPCQHLHLNNRVLAGSRTKEQLCTPAAGEEPLPHSTTTTAESSWSTAWRSGQPVPVVLTPGHKTWTESK